MHWVHFENSHLLEEYYDKFLSGAVALDPAWRDFFASFSENSQTPITPLATPLVAPLALDVEARPFVAHDIAAWIEERASPSKKIELAPEHKKELYRLLAEAELFETFLHTKFVGQKRFSLEGAETLIPMLTLIVDRCSHSGIDEIALGMTHRGRLNVLANIFQKPLEEILVEFQEGELDLLEGGGDVKYHKGFASKLKRHAADVQLTMLSNPSHLESVDCVLEGFARGKAATAKVLPLLVHGDAALAGQGVVYETLQLSRLEGYTTKGTIHIVLNNHIGFTTTPKDFCSMHRCTDIAKAFGFPVFHVSAEDPEKCIWAMELAFECRQKFHIDVFVDLDCYRKYGHNESDEPAYTQPLLYAEIRKKPSIHTQYQKHVDTAWATHIDTEIQNKLHAEYDKFAKNKKNVYKSHEKRVIAKELPPVSQDELHKILTTLTAVPEGFTVHSRLKKQIEERQKAQTVDWALGEALGVATIIQQGVPVRLTGQDTRRGTFSQRHAVWIDQHTETGYVPLQHVGGASFEVYDSSLSEYAALGFEYGYTLGNTKTLVMWEAQFGDFANGAAVIIDQYIAAGESKWNNHSKLVLLLPHGYEGQGPEHSSGRMERFLQLAAENNMVIAVPTTPAQYFHLLRRQACAGTPLIVFTPKGLLRHPEATSSFAELAEGSFHEIIEDATLHAERVILCQGRVYYDLIAEKRKAHDERSAIIRIEQLYPFPKMAFEKIVAKYTKVHTKVHTWLWVQEEPENAGAWSYVRDFIPQAQYIGRKRAATPAVGSHTVHEKEYATIMRQVYY